MADSRAAPLACALALLLVGCGGKAVRVEDGVPGDLYAVRSQDFQRIYFVPFDQSDVSLEGEHGVGEQIARNQRLWFPHLLIGAQRELGARVPDARVVAVGEGPSEEVREAMKRTAISIPWEPAAPEGAVVVSGAYVVAREVLSKGMFGGTTHTQVTVTIRVDDSEVYHCTIDGRYVEDDDRFSWGYQTLGANETVGRGIIELLARLRAGETDVG